MKILFFDEFVMGVIGDDGSVVDVSSAVADIPHLQPQDQMRGLIENFDQYQGRLAEAVSAGGGAAADDVRIRPPLPRPLNIDCMAVNYMEDGTRDEPAPINGFHKSPSSIIGHGDTMVLQDIPATVFEGEAELGLVIGKRATEVGEADAMDHVFGYVNFIDGSARGLGPGMNTFFMMKSRETYSPVGPYIVTKDEIADPQNLRVRLWNNGEIKQNFNTDDMAHKIPRCVEWASHCHTLEPGDILATGTNHRGLHAFQDGDVVELEVEGCGRLRINIRDGLERTWGPDTRLEHAEKGLDGVHTPQLTGKYAPEG